MDKGSFSIGIDWKYSDHSSYQNGIGDNKYKNSEYRVYPRFKDLKEEMLNYQYISKKEVDQIFVKAKEYKNTNMAKSLNYGTGIKEDNLICIILYCDYSDLSRDFTLSFRKSHSFQLLSTINQHNSRYYHWSNTLRDTVEEYGKNNIDDDFCGPFYCGMSIPLLLSQFNMFIYGPLSTSVHIEVALKFSGEDGMILQMDNDRGDAIDLKGFDVSWISRYKEEDERYVYTLILLL